MDSPSNSASRPIPIPPGRRSPIDTPSPSPPARATPLKFSEGDAELSLTAVYIVKTAHGRTLLSQTSSDDDRAAAAAQIMSAVLQRDPNDDKYVESARAIIDHVHGYAVADNAFGEGPDMIFPMDDDRVTREWERNDTEWKHRVLQFMSEAKILEMGAIGRELTAQMQGRELVLGSEERAGERGERRGDEERIRFQLERSLYLQARETEAASIAETVVEPGSAEIERME
ncbi:hypothetical protein EV356DRAFT_575175 [Viridothelium virens]|uniref:Uncharacterized protein n=1 Tax=Viridothelium virens TaxID=1048519 RepID=A0A6A6HFH3_VIRVR|nr:hypothetical protein EV356DRAFT_575175 [Viridothelium virens]